MSRRRTLARTGALGLALLAGIAACAGGDDDDGSAGDRLPDLTVPALLAGEPELDLAELDGPAVVNLWATWCVPCRRELPDFQTASEQHPDVRFVGIDIGEDVDDAQAFIDELGVTFDQFADLDGELSGALGVASLPVTIVIDGNGVIDTRHLGPMSIAELDEAIAALPPGS